MWPEEAKASSNAVAHGSSMADLAVAVHEASSNCLWNSAPTELENASMDTARDCVKKTQEFPK